MFVRVASAAPFAVGLLLLTGCGAAKLDVSKSWELQPGDEQALIFPKQSKPQKIKIEYSADADVTVLLFKAEDAPEDKLATADASKALGSKTGKGETFVVDVPANTETCLVVRGMQKSTKVSVKATN